MMVALTKSLLSLIFIPSIIRCQPTQLPETRDLYAKERCEGYRAVDETEFRNQCEKDSTFRFYFCGKTCDALYGTPADIKKSKQKALTKSCMDVFSDDFCARFKGYGKCGADTETAYTSFRICLKTCGYCNVTKVG